MNTAIFLIIILSLFNSGNGFLIDEFKQDDSEDGADIAEQEEDPSMGSSGKVALEDDSE